MRAKFWKYQALGNDMLVIDPGHCDLVLTPVAIQLICHRNLGVGGDGICYGPLLDHGHPRAMRFFNPDGSEAEKSGNGLRIFARYLWDAQIVKDREFTVAIGVERVPVRVIDELAQYMILGMGHLKFGAVEEEMTFGDESFPVTKVSIGNPHAVIFTNELARIRDLGRVIENAPQFPNRTNVQFARVLDRHQIEIEIWERGVGYTMASGTSCSAAAGAAVRTGRCLSPVEVKMAGGSARVTIGEDWGVELEGSVSQVFQGSFSLELQQQLLSPST